MCQFLSAVVTENDERLIDGIEAARRYSVHPKTFYRWSRQGLVPQPVKRPGGSVAWKLSEIIEHINQLARAEEREMAEK